METFENFFQFTEDELEIHIESLKIEIDIIFDKSIEQINRLEEKLSSKIRALKRRKKLFATPAYKTSIKFLDAFKNNPCRHIKSDNIGKLKTLKH